MSLSWDEKVTELIERFCDEQTTLSIRKESDEFFVTGTKGEETQTAQSDDLVVALMQLAGMNPEASDRRDYDPSED